MADLILRRAARRAQQPQIMARGGGRSRLLLNFTNLKPQPNQSQFSPQSWNVGAASVIRPAAGGLGLYCGSSVAGNSFGSAAAFDAFSPASTAAWLAVVITGAAYASQGSGVNIIASYGSANAASGWYFYLDSSSNLGARCGNTDITTTRTLSAGRVYHIVACRTASGACELWLNGVRVGSGSGATAAVAGNAYALYVGGDSGTARAYQGTVHALALGTRDIVGSEAASLSQNLYGLFVPITRRIWVPVSAGGSTATGLSTETDSAFTLAAIQIRAAAASTESDTALPLAAVSIRSTGLATETSAALALAAAQTRAVGLSAETDTALALSAGAAMQVGLAAETDTAMSLAAVQIAAIGRASETDTALALEVGAVNTVGRADETETALALSAVQVLPVGLTIETGTALALSPVQVLAPGLSLEINTGFALAAVQAMVVGRADETDTAAALTAASGTASAAEVWSYMMSNGHTAEENVVAIRSMLEALTPATIADEVLHNALV